ncbi:von Willebrand factor, type A domain containing protein [Rhodotorula toruloides]|uniref:von Willebrand factor, type A domain containing protein n=1 Tax=Rhodotorula toruloides TaxID=5286 RepID=A0A511KNP6_RHOTO|nr:von Willebrand factor, type A domain containing protein [Rhodotorula toruloides]
MGLITTLALAYGAKQASQAMTQFAQAQQQKPPLTAGQPQHHCAQGPPQQHGFAAAPPPGQNSYHPAYGAASSGYHSVYISPQQQHAPPPPHYGYAAPHAGSGPALDVNCILRILQQAVQDQNIQAFYPPGTLEPLAHRIAQSGALARIAHEWNLPVEIAMDLARLALFDVVLLVDDSGSMAFEENGSRIDDAKLVVSRVATASTLFDTDGMSVFFLNSPVVGQAITNEQQAQALVSSVQFSGLTPLGTALKQNILQPLVVQPAFSNTLRKPVLVILITDGEPSSEPRTALSQSILGAKNALSQTRYGPDALSIQLAQVGDDAKARMFLDEVDRDREVGGLVDVTGTYEWESEQVLRLSGITLTPDMWLVKLLLGGINSAYDRKDEGRY